MGRCPLRTVRCPAQTHKHTQHMPNAHLLIIQSSSPPILPSILSRQTSTTAIRTRPLLVALAPLDPCQGPGHPSRQSNPRCFLRRDSSKRSSRASALSATLPQSHLSSNHDHGRTDGRTQTITTFRSPRLSWGSALGSSECRRESSRGLGPFGAHERTWKEGGVAHIWSAYAVAVRLLSSFPSLYPLLHLHCSYSLPILIPDF